MLLLDVFLLPNLPGSIIVLVHNSRGSLNQPINGASSTVQVEQEKSRVAQELQTFIDTANAPIFGIDHNGMVNEWNNKSVEITGYSREEVMGKSLVDVYISEDFRESVKSVLDDALNGKGTANFEFPIFTVDRRRIEILLNATPRCNVKGEVPDPEFMRFSGLSAKHFTFSLGNNRV